MTIASRIKERYDHLKSEEMSLNDYLERARDDKSLYTNAADRLLKAIGDPKIIDTSKDERLSRIFANRKIRTYEKFDDFYGLEEVIDQIVGYLRHSAQGLEEHKQVLYLLGAVGTAKSSLSDRLKKLMEEEPIYVLTANNVMSPVFESPLGLFAMEDAQELNIPPRVLRKVLSPWANKRLNEFEGDITKFSVSKVYPSLINQRAISKTEPGDENNQDISTLVGKVDIKKLAKFSQNDPDAYSYSGGLCLANQGLLEFVEMFKAPIKVLHPLLTATQEGTYNGTEAISGLPFEGIVLAHSNESEWEAFRSNRNNEAFIDRIYIVRVPYCLRIDEEVKIYKKMLRDSDLSGGVTAPQTLEIMAKWSIATRCNAVPNGSIYTKVLSYNGENAKELDIKAKTAQEYKEQAGNTEGMIGASTRFAFKTLSKTYNFDYSELAADPVHLFAVLDQQIENEQLGDEKTTSYLAFTDLLRDKYHKFIEKEIQSAYLESADELGQNLFDRYIRLADCWSQESIDYRDADTNELWSKDQIDKELKNTEVAAEITNFQDFRKEVVSFVNRVRANNKGENPKWTSYAKLRDVIEQVMFKHTEDLLPIISFGTKDNKENTVKHKEFIKRMVDRGYTDKQVRVLVDWFVRRRKN